MIKVGLTGGMASGKSTFCDVWESLGAYVVKADDLAKSLMVSDSNVKNALVKQFGAQTYNEKGELNRVYLAEEAFNKGRVEDLNAIVHPAVYRELLSLIKKAEKQYKPIFLYEAAILLQKGRPGLFDYIIWVDAVKSDQITRAIKRSKISSIEAEKRLHLQPSLDEVKDLVDITCYNNSSIESFMDEAATLFHQIAAKSDLKETRTNDRFTGNTPHHT
jgi:dephospho-CoA kinase